jgi:hypothetical protein
MMGEAPYVAQPLYNAEADLLSFVTEDVPTVARQLAPGFDLLLSLDRTQVLGAQFTGVRALVSPNPGGGEALREKVERLTRFANSITGGATFVDRVPVADDLRAILASLPTDATAEEGASHTVPSNHGRALDAVTPCEGAGLDGLADFLLDHAASTRREADGLVGGQANRLRLEADDCERWAAALSQGGDATGWHRDGSLLYTLEQTGWRRGEPVMQNRLMVTVSGGPNTPKAEVDALAAHLMKVLPRSSPGPHPMTPDKSDLDRMVEAAARAAYEVEREMLTFEGIEPPTWDKLPAPIQRNWLSGSEPVVLAVLDELRKPSAAMLQAAADCLATTDDRSAEGYAVALQDAREALCAITDAIRPEQQP